MNSLQHDLEDILKHTSTLWDELRHQRVFITGGTGFFGSWFLESFVWINEKLKLNAKAVVLTRNKAKFAQKCPHLIGHPSLHFQEGDVRDFDFPPGTFSHVIHAATDASVELNQSDPALMLDTIVQGTQRVLEFSKAAATSKFLLISSGAVYGMQPSDVTHLQESDTCQSTDSAYAMGKLAAESMAHEYAKQGHLAIKIARCFAFVGPYLPLNTHYAIGNFIRDAIHSDEIIVQGDGTTCRSYLYASDLMIWLWTILFRGQSLHPYNVGSDQSISIKDLAEMVANHFEPRKKISILKAPQSNASLNRYVPCIDRVKEELQLSPVKSLADAIQATIDWHLWKKTSLVHT